MGVKHLSNDTQFAVHNFIVILSQTSMLGLKNDLPRAGLKGQMTPAYDLQGPAFGYLGAHFQSAWSFLSQLVYSIKGSERTYFFNLARVYGRIYTALATSW